jgi:hypothetical protein
MPNDNIAGHIMTQFLSQLFFFLSQLGKFLFFKFLWSEVA